MAGLRVAILGAGIGGLSAAAALERIGLEVTVFEQAARFSRIGAGIQIGCNAMKVLREFGLEGRLRAQAFRPRSWNNRDHDTGAIRFDMQFGDAAEARYGAPYLLAHRSDLHAALASVVPQASVRLDHRLVGIEPAPGGSLALQFENGARFEADALVAADGVHSFVRTQLFGADASSFTGRVAYRAVFSADRLGGERLDDCTKWWGSDRHIVIYYVNPDRSEVYFVTSQPDPDFDVESWSALGNLDELRAAFANFTPQVLSVLAACPSVHKWALFDRNPLPRWSEGNITLLGDACHPMTPYMAQGAAMAIEDAAVLSRCLAGVEREGVAQAFRRFEATRKPRCTRVQLSSRSNTWLREATDPDWVYGYDAWNDSLAAA
jgi:salicylate hydroxylase/6-hydroxynicotinate 3-monooxygenase